MRGLVAAVVREAAVVVQFHMVAMFAPSFVTGHLVKRFGAPALQLLGATLLAAGGGIMLGYVDRLVGFAASQAAVGVGWNFCFVASTAALSQQTRPSERVAAQAATDLVVFGSSGACSRWRPARSASCSSEMAKPPIAVAPARSAAMSARDAALAAVLAQSYDFKLPPNATVGAIRTQSPVEVPARCQVM